jgi:amino acid adenylation domain-containing protein
VIGPHTRRSFREALGELALAVPDRVAIDDGSRALTYSELLCAVDGVAAAVRGEPGAPVTVVVDHASDAVVALLGVIAAGGIAVPVDPRDPFDRLGMIHRDAGSSLVMTGSRSIATARSLAAGAPVVLTDELDDGVARARPKRGSGAFDPARPAMLLFTSGSTGTPKGVAISGGSIVANALQVAHASVLTPDDRIAVPGSLAFGATQSRIFAALVSGARACLFDLRGRGPIGLPDWVNANGITVMFFVPSVLRALLDAAPDAYMGTVRLVTFGGEALYGRDTRRARALFGPDAVFRIRLSSTETQGMAGHVITAADDDRDGIIPVGEVEPWLEARIVDDDGRDVAAGDVGRLVVIGRDLALGYWNDPALTAERFADLPDGRRAFTTNDLVRRLDDGALLHVGRADDRVKVHGAMVATHEVEAALTSLPEVADAAVVGIPADDGGTRLVAYVVARRGTALSTWKLRRDLAGRLPSASVPTAFVAVESLPRTVRDKVDRKALPPPPPVVQQRPYREPAGGERDLADLFSRVLGVERVGLDDDFFDLGGDSLGVVELLAGIAERFSVDVPASTVLEAPTVAELSLRLSHRRPRDTSPVVMLRSDAQDPPLFCVTGGGDPAISLRSLSDAIGDHNFAAIQPRGLEERAIPDHSVRAAARRNIAAMRAVQPSGPYTIGGYSYGGVVAFEMACQLRAAGQQVAWLVILDTRAPASRRSLGSRARDRARTLQAGAPLPPLRRAALVALRAAWLAAGSAYAHAERRITLTSAGWLPRRGYRQHDLFERLNSRMKREYTPSGIFDGATLVVRGDASDGLPPGTEDPPDPAHRALADLGWSKLVSGPVTTAGVPADHLSLLHRPAVDLVAAHITNTLY